MQKCVSGLLFAIMLLLCALGPVQTARAETITSFDALERALGSLAKKDWRALETQDIRLFDLGEGASVCACVDGEQVETITIEAPTGQEDVIRDVLTRLGFDASCADLTDGAREVRGDVYCFRLVGATRSEVCLCAAADQNAIVWQAVHGGEKLHNNPKCSGMDVSRLLSERAAEALGLEDCEKCRAGGAAAE